MSRLLRVMFVTCLIFPISARNVEETFASFFFCFIWNWFGLKNACVFFQNCSLSNISFWILKLFVFHAVTHFLGLKIGWRQARRSPDGLYPRFRFVSLQESDWHLENSRKKQNNSLPKEQYVVPQQQFSSLAKNRRLSRLIAVKTWSFVQCLQLTNVFQKSVPLSVVLANQMLSLTVLSKIIPPTTVVKVCSLQYL